MPAVTNTPANAPQNSGPGTNPAVASSASPAEENIATAAAENGMPGVNSAAVAGAVKTPLLNEDKVISSAATANNGIMPLDIVHANMERMSTPAVAPFVNPGDVKFKVNYGADYKGAKEMPEGSVQVVSKESAAHFEKLGIGSIIK